MASALPRQRALLAWYDRHGRDLPWRRRPSLYGTWVAEIMLQQTTVSAVIPRWERFMARFPDLVAPATAPESAVLAAWAGLGYYRRARLLHRAARQLAAADAGLPRTLGGWRALPGVGEYAAGAIASIGLGLAEPAIDANVRRVLVRWTSADPVAARGWRPAALRDLARVHVSPVRPGDWNQALMDLGAGPCRAGRADCGACPVLRWCAAGRAGASADVPEPRQRSRTVPVVLGSLVLRQASRVLYLPASGATVGGVRGLGRPVRTGLDGLFAAMVSVPLTRWYRDTGAPAAPFLAAWRNWLRSLGCPAPVVELIDQQRHAITTHRLRVIVATAELPRSRDLNLPRQARWARADAEVPAAGLARASVAAATRARYADGRD